MDYLITKMYSPIVPQNNYYNSARTIMNIFCALQLAAPTIQIGLKQLFRCMPIPLDLILLTHF